MAGGVAGGANAAETICRAWAHDLDATSWLRERDAALAAEGTGQAAAIVISIADDGEILGASAGDCEAWIFSHGDATNLTSGQVRKPLLGDGAEPVAVGTRAQHEVEHALGPAPLTEQHEDLLGIATVDR